MANRKTFYICLTIAITVFFALIGAFAFTMSYLRLGESFYNLYDAFKFFFRNITNIHLLVKLPVKELSKYMQWDILLPSDFNSFKVSAQQYFSLLFDINNFKQYLSNIGSVLIQASKILVIALPCIVLFFFALSKLYMKGNTKHNKDTVPLKIFKWISGHTYQPVKKFLLNYCAFLQKHSIIKIIWLLIWLCNLNLSSIVVEFFAYYFYFVSSFNTSTIYTQVCKFFIDLQVLFKTVPWWSLVIVAYFIFDHIRKKIALSVLQHYEARNCGFINELPIVSMTCGSMGKKKTTMVTDMALSQEIMFRQKALEIIQKNDMKFPYFPWMAFELELKKCIENRTIYNLATVKKFINTKMARFEISKDSTAQLYGYDYKKYGLYYCNQLKNEYIFDVLETYAKAYFIYIVESSLIVSNYAIRVDSKQFSGGNFPLWASNFFAKGLSKGRYSHILDFDTLRLGRKVIENNPNIGSFEFGVVVISEVGKERGNNLELKDIKKNTDSTNQKNDLFNSWLKMCRHSATVDNFPFIKVFTDEQRPESWGADARDLCDIINIVTSGKQQLALPFYTLEDMLSEWMFNRFLSFYTNIRFVRGDNTLLCHIFKSITAWLWHKNICIYNRFGYSVLKIEKERGTMDGKTESKRYYIMNKKIYSRRFSTDCFSDYFCDMAKNSSVGLNDYLEYACERASIDELKAQNSYFVNSLYKNNE